MGPWRIKFVCDMTFNLLYNYVIVVIKVLTIGFNEYNSISYTEICVKLGKILISITVNIIEDNSPYSTGNWLPNANEMDTTNMKCTWPT